MSTRVNAVATPPNTCRASRARRACRYERVAPVALVTTLSCAKMHGLDSVSCRVVSWRNKWNWGTDQRTLRQSEQKHDDAEDGDDGDLFSLQRRELVDDGRDDRLNHGELTVDAETEQHHEEQHWPERSDRHHRDSFRIRHERQARTCAAIHNGEFRGGEPAPPPPPPFGDGLMPWLPICDSGTVLWRHHRQFISSNT